MRIYDLEFGQRGLSIMHFIRDVYHERKYGKKKVNMNNFAATVDIPEPYVPTSMNEVLVAVTNFLHYTQQIADSQTVQVATALYQFVTEFDARYNMPLDISEFVRWIDDQLQWYRNQVDIDSETGTSIRSQAVQRFRVNNGDLQCILHASLAKRQKEFENRLLSMSKTPAAIKSHTRMPPSVLPLIPKNPAGKQLCLRYVTNNGCPCKIM